MRDAAPATKRSRENRTRYVVLGMLSAEPLTGYALRQRIAGSVGHFWQESYGQLYPTLRRLTAEGLAAARAPRRGPGRTAITYEVTPRGREALAEWVARPPAVEPVRNELLLKVFFAGAAPPEVTLRNLGAMGERLRAQRAGLERLAQGFAAMARGHRDAPYWKLTIDFGLRFLQAGLEWIDHALAVIRAQGPAPASGGPRRSRARGARAAAEESR